MARQGELFPTTDRAVTPTATHPLLAHQLLEWQRQIARYQSPLFRDGAAPARQASLFDDQAQPVLGNPLRWQPQSLQFWRWPDPPQQGAALYFVIDQAPAVAAPLLLYVGETGQAGRRWRGDHDCKAYLAAYGDALGKAGLDSRLSIRFDLDAPAAIRARRALEQVWIRHWQPPFNKETRGRWSTPFTADAPA